MSGRKRTRSNDSARKAVFLLSHVSCSIVLAYIFLHLFIYLLHLYQPLSPCFPQSTTRIPSPSTVLPTEIQNNPIFVTSRADAEKQMKQSNGGGKKKPHTTKPTKQHDHCYIMHTASAILLQIIKKNPEYTDSTQKSTPPPHLKHVF